jgi:hypothetical protein
MLRVQAKDYPVITNQTTRPPTLQGLTRIPPTQIMSGPPPINAATTGGYPPRHGPPLPGAPPIGPSPPQYGGAAYPNPGMGAVGNPAQYGARNNAVEVEGAGRSKSQLIVGIDLVSFLEVSL